MEAVRKPVSRRNLVSLIMFFSIGLLPVSGLSLHFLGSLPEINFYRHAMMTVHNVASIIFFVSSVIHITLNRKSIINYLVNKTRDYRPVKKEAVIALSIVLGLVSLSLSHVFIAGSHNGRHPGRGMNHSMINQSVEPGDSNK